MLSGRVEMGRMERAHVESRSTLGWVESGYVVNGCVEN